MNDQPESNVGSRIRIIREQRKMSLRALAERCKLSANAISLIERGENSPTVSSLHALATSLGVKITAFFEESHDQTVVLVRKDQRLRADGTGLVMESLGIGLHDQQLEPFLTVLMGKLHTRWGHNHFPSMLAIASCLRLHNRIFPRTSENLKQQSCWFSTHLRAAMWRGNAIWTTGAHMKLRN